MQPGDANRLWIDFMLYTKSTYYACGIVSIKHIKCNKKIIYDCMILPRYHHKYDNEEVMLIFNLNLIVINYSSDLYH